QIERLHVHENGERLEVGNLVAGQFERFDVQALLQAGQAGDFFVRRVDEIDVFQIVLFQLFFFGFFQLLADDGGEVFVGKQRSGSPGRGGVGGNPGEQSQHQRTRSEPIHRGRSSRQEKDR